MSTKEEKYALLLKQADALTEGETDIIANMSNLTALIQGTFHFWWCGFYLVKENELVLGPFQGPVACTRIGYGKGVCGTAWKERRTILVPDIEKFPGHIACSAASRSEIVVPIFQNDTLIAVLDIDSKGLNTFDETDRKNLEQVVSYLV